MRLIDADALKESLTETLHRCDEWIENAKDEETRIIAESNYTAFLESILRVKDAPTIEPKRGEWIDAVPVVRCKDCKWWTKQEKSIQGRCALAGIYPTGGWYCGNGERKDDEIDRR